MKRARELLADPALGITDIALAVGYGTPSAFTASFRKHLGVTPTNFRRRNISTVTEITEQRVSP
jgi:AraC family transcriptional regulator